MPKILLQEILPQKYFLWVQTILANIAKCIIYFKVSLALVSYHRIWSLCFVFNIEETILCGSFKSKKYFYLCLIWTIVFIHLIHKKAKLKHFPNCFASLAASWSSRKWSKHPRQKAFPVVEWGICPANQLKTRPGTRLKNSRVSSD